MTRPSLQGVRRNAPARGGGDSAAHAAGGHSSAQAPPSAAPPRGYATARRDRARGPAAGLPPGGPGCAVCPPAALAAPCAPRRWPGVRCAPPAGTAGSCAGPPRPHDAAAVATVPPASPYLAPVASAVARRRPRLAFGPAGAGRVAPPSADPGGIVTAYLVYICTSLSPLVVGSVRVRGSAARSASPWTWLPRIACGSWACRRRSVCSTIADSPHVKREAVRGSICTYQTGFG